MTNEEIIDGLYKIKAWAEVAGDVDFWETANNTIRLLEQQPCEDCVSREDALKAIEEQKKGFYGVERYAIDECHSAVMKLPPVTPSYNSIKTELKPCEDCIRELIREFDNKHPALFADYMQEFNNHPISEIIDYMWDMHDLIEDIEYRLPDEGGTESK